MHSLAAEVTVTGRDAAGSDTAPLLNLHHLDHQTLGDAVLRNDVLQLFLLETPKYVSDLQLADDCKSWRMAIHTLKGVSLNLGAFRLAQLCKQFESPEAASSPQIKRNAAEAITQLLAETCEAISNAMPPRTLPRA